MGNSSGQEKKKKKKKKEKKKDPPKHVSDEYAEYSDDFMFAHTEAPVEDPSFERKRKKKKKKKKKASPDMVSAGWLCARGIPENRAEAYSRSIKEMTIVHLGTQLDTAWFSTTFVTSVDRNRVAAFFKTEAPDTPEPLGGDPFPLLDVPSDLLWGIFKFLSIPETGRLRFVCRALNDALEDRMIWMQAFNWHYGFQVYDVSRDWQRLCRTAYIKSFEMEPAEQLQWAIAQNFPRLLRSVLESNDLPLNSEYPTKHGFLSRKTRALDLAVELDHPECAAELLRHGAPVHPETLEFAAHSGNASMLNMLLFTGGTTATGGLYRQATLEGRAEIFRVLLKSGVAFDEPEVFASNHAAFIKACHAGYTEVVKLVVTTGLNVNMCDSHSRVPVYEACKKGHSEVLLVLLQAGASPEGAHCNPAYLTLEKQQRLRTPTYSPLTEACRGGHGDCVRLLLEAGADATRTTGRPFTNTFRTDMIGLVPTSIPPRGELLHMACATGSLDCTRAITDWMQARGNVGLTDGCGFTALHVAAFCGQVDIVRLLLELRLCDIEAATEINGTALQIAIDAAQCSPHHDTGCIAALLEHGAEATDAMHFALRSRVEMYAVLPILEGARRRGIQLKYPEALGGLTSHNQSRLEAYRDLVLPGNECLTTGTCTICGAPPPVEGMACSTGGFVCARDVGRLAEAASILLDPTSPVWCGSADLSS